MFNRCRKVIIKTNTNLVDETRVALMEYAGGRA